MPSLPRKGRPHCGVSWNSGDAARQLGGAAGGANWRLGPTASSRAGGTHGPQLPSVELGQFPGTTPTSRLSSSPFIYKQIPVLNIYRRVSGYFLPPRRVNLDFDFKGPFLEELRATSALLLAGTAAPPQQPTTSGPVPTNAPLSRARSPPTTMNL